jgi:hypothetical protein
MIHSNRFDVNPTASHCRLPTAGSCVASVLSRVIVYNRSLGLSSAKKPGKSAQPAPSRSRFGIGTLRNQPLTEPRP